MKKSRYKKFLNKNKDQVFSYAMYLMRCQEDAEDITQEVFMKLWNNWNRINPQKRGSWTMRVTHNCCIDLIRERKKLKQISYDANKIDFNKVSDYENVFLNPEKQYNLTEQQKLILSSLSQLPKKQQNILILHYFFDMKIRKISDMLEIKESTIKVILHRARKSMKTLLSEYFYEKTGGQHEFAV